MDNTQTTFLGLTKPGFQKPADVRVLNTDLDTVDAAASRNLLVNPGFEVWQRGALTFTANLAYTADRWQLLLNGASTASVSQDASNVSTGSKYAVAVAYTQSTTSYLAQKLEDLTGLRGRTLTFAADVKASVVGAFRLDVYDGTTRTAGTYHSGGGGFERLSVTVAIPAAATLVQVELVLGGSGTVYLDNATLYIGSAPVAYAPLNPAEDLVRCQRYTFIAGGLDTAEVAGPAMCYAATTALGFVRFPVEMAVAPTMTLSAVSDWAVYSAALALTTCTGLTSATNRRGARLAITVAAGLVAGNASFVVVNNTTAARMIFEANP